MAFPLSKTPVVLFPLKVETRFIENELWIRAFPDEAFLQSHDPRLTQEERTDALAFKEHSSEENKKVAWEKLVAKYGAYRSAWLVQITIEELESQAQTAAQEGEISGNEEPTFYFKWLPDRLVTYLFRKGETSPAYKEEGAIIDREGLTILGEGDEWVENFEEAVKAGMGMKIKLRNPTTDIHFDKVIVTGIRYAEDPLVPAKGLTDLFRNHQYTEGLSFLEYGTPTNNTNKEESGHSIREEFNASTSYEYAVNGFTDESMSAVAAGPKLAKSLGVDADDFKHFRRAGMAEPTLNELFQKASWFAQGAQSLFMLFGHQISSEAHEALWHHYAQYVRSRGSYSPLKIGNQPYGVLPVMSIRKILEDETIANLENTPGKMAPVLARLFERWLEMAEGDQTNIPRLGDADDSYTEMYKILSMQEYSTSYQVRALEYDHTRAKFQNWLQHLPPTASGRDWLPQLNTAPLLKIELDAIQPNITALHQIANDFYEGPEQLLQVPLLSFKDGGENSLGEAGLDFTQEDLSAYKDFLQQLEAATDYSIIQYKGELSLFTDLLLRSYINACQLYHREIPFEPSIADLKEYSLLTIREIKVQEEAFVEKGTIVLEINASKKGIANSDRTISVRAPFSGKIEKLQVESGTAVAAGQSLFRLINVDKRNAIKQEFISLGYQIVAACEAIENPEKRKEAQKVALREVIDINSYRLDAWISSLPARRIVEMRADTDFEKGIYFGAYGWVEHLSKDTTDTVDASMTDTYGENGGIIHTPGSPQAVASAVFKNSFLSYKQEESTPQEGNPFMLNLTSDRIQKSGFLLEGIRQGQKVEALLGYQLERYLHEHKGVDLHNELYELREAFPLDENISVENGQATALVQMSVIDGLKAINNKDNLPVAPSKKATIKKYIEKLEDVLDGSLDTLFYEAGYQVTQGNLSQAAAALDATKGAIEPPEIDSLKTRIPGVGIRHKIALVISEPTGVFDLKNSKAFAEPVLESWLMGQLGNFEKIGCEVHLSQEDEETPTLIVSVKLSDLGIGYLDFLYLSDDPVADGASELELRIWNFVRAQETEIDEKLKFRITDIAPPGCQPLSRAIEIARYTNDFLNKCRYLTSEDLTLDEEAIHYHQQALERIKTERLSPLIQKLKSLQDTALTRDFLMEDLSLFDLEEAKSVLSQGVEIEVEKLKAEIAEKVALAEEHLAKYDLNLPYYTAFEHLNEAAKALFGKSFILLPPAVGSDQFHQIIDSNKQHLLLGQDGPQQSRQDIIQDWIEGVAQVRENTEALEDWQMVRKVWEANMPLEENNSWQIVQGPTLLQYPWLALSKSEIDSVLENNYQANEIYLDEATNTAFPLADGSYYPEGVESVILKLPENFSFEADGQKLPVYGFVVEEFSEHIPDEQVDTGLSFHYNAPNSEPPQAILLAVHPKSMMESSFFWSEDDLKDILYDTMDLYKIRMVDLEAIQEYGSVLPMTVWPNLPAMR